MVLISNEHDFYFTVNGQRALNFLPNSVMNIKHIFCICNCY